MGRQNSSRTVIKARDFEGQFDEFWKAYQVYPELTKKLDAFTDDFDDAVINEIVLWKLSRHVSMPEGLLTKLNGVRNLKPKEHRQASELVTCLQKVKGVQIAMASTFLRFANPHVFQIMDRHAYRALYGAKLGDRFEATRGTDIYLKYLDDLHGLCESKAIEFCHADRILFQFDKAKNPPLDQPQ